MEVDISSLGDLAKLRRKIKVATVILSDAQGGNCTYQVDKVNFTIGKASKSDIRVSGWLSPKQAAFIQRRPDGFYLVPSRRGKVTINHMAVTQMVKLNDGDELNVRGLVLKFFFRPADDA